MDYYSELGEGYKDLHWAEQADKLRILSMMIAAKKGEKLLDVGCGPGWAKQFFDCEYHGIDPAKEQVKDKEGCVIGKAEDLPFPDGYFDAVICVTALHNVENPLIAISEMVRVSKGRIGITILKKSKKAEMLTELIDSMLEIVQRVDQSSDTILLCRKK